ncbi:hypothetical protein [Mesorhizobium prunaredense]|uniref:hypothetical protein n=1 Tax=Mesorhizobium prunaredense TaxID=1631249 RepID=UPI000984C30E|nr:hypothetical protein [Mesorhizobium prunaredense]
MSKLFLVNGKLRVAKGVGDGKVAYWRGPQTPASILTSEQLEEIQRLNGTRLLLPFVFLALGAVLVFLFAKGQIPPEMPILFGLVATILCVYAIVNATQRIAKILDRAPRQLELPAHVPASVRFTSLWQNQSSFHLIIGTWFAGFVFASSVFGLIAKLLDLESYDPTGRLHPIALLFFAIISYVVFATFLKERRRRKNVAHPEQQ